MSGVCQICGTWENKETEGQFKVNIWRQQATKGNEGTFFMGGVDPSKHHNLERKKSRLLQI